MSITYSPSKKVLISCDNKEETVIVPEGITQIKKEAFKDCTNLKEITLPESLKTIGVAAFQNCSSLKRIVIPAEVKILCKYVFYGCKALEEVILSEGLEKISALAFARCESLQKIILPDSLKSADSYIFSRCRNLEEICYRNIKIHIDITQLTYFRRVIKFIRNPVLSEKIDSTVKYDILWQMLFLNPEDEKLKEYIKQYFSKIFLLLLDRDDAESVQKILDNYDFITKNNIDRFIRYAIDKKKIQTQLLLMHYKAAHDLQKPKNLFL